MEAKERSGERREAGGSRARAGRNAVKSTDSCLHVSLPYTLSSPRECYCRGKFCLLKKLNSSWYNVFPVRIVVFLTGSIKLHADDNLHDETYYLQRLLKRK